MIEVARRDRTKLRDAVIDFLTLYCSGFLAYLSYIIFVTFSLDSGSILSTDAGLLESFLCAGILDFLGEVISTETDLGILVCLYYSLEGLYCYDRK